MRLPEWLRHPVAAAIVRIVLVLVLTEVDSLVREEHHLGILRSEAARIAVGAAGAVIIGLRGRIGRIPIPALGGFVAILVHAMTGSFIQLYLAVYFTVLELNRYAVLLSSVVSVFVVVQLYEPAEYELRTAYWVWQLSYVVLAILAGIAVRNSRQLNASLALASWEMKERTRREAELRHQHEKVRLSQRLHDELGHHLTALYMRGMALKVGESGSRDDELVDQIVGDAQTSLQRLRSMLSVFNEIDAVRSEHAKEELDDLEDFIRRLNGTGITVEFNREGSLASLPPDVQELGFVVIRESLTNVIKHAPGATVWVELRAVEDDLTVSVTNTKGSRRSMLRLSSGGMGLRGLADRVRDHGGHFSADTTPSGGFAVTASIPVPDSYLIDSDLAAKPSGTEEA